MVLAFLVAVILEIYKLGIFHPRETRETFLTAYKGYYYHILGCSALITLI